MSYLQSMLEQLPGVQFTDVLDVLIVAFLIYKLLPVFRSTGTGRIAGIVVVVIVISWLTDILKLHTLNFILSQLLAVGLIAIVVLFQPELRRMIDHVSHIQLMQFFGVERPSQEMIPVIEQTVMACQVMSREKIGALIVFARRSHLDEYFKTGTMMDAQLSEQLLRNVFFPRASLHDGAVIVRGGRIAAAGCVVSEETGAISVAVGGVLKRHLAPQTLEKLLHHELCPEDTQQEETLVLKLRQKLQKKEKGGK